jgi:Protein of unknown function (DUF2849)
MPQMIIANRLVDGAVVFLAPGEGWTPVIASGVVIDDEAEAQRLLGAVKELEARSPVIDPQVIQVKRDNDGVVRPVEIRELIRAFGPTVRTERGDTDWEPMPGLVRQTGERREPGVARVNKNSKE